MSKNNIKELIINNCLELLKKEHVKNEIKSMIKHIIYLFINELYPWILSLCFFSFISFLLILGIFFKLVVRNKISNI